MNKAEIQIICDGFRKALASSTQGTWKKGETSHQTVSNRGVGKPYHVGDFRHADDAWFCEFAHVFLPNLLDEVERLQAIETASEWKPIETAPAAGKFLVYGGTWEGEIGSDDETQGIHLIEKYGERFDVVGTDAYSAWVINPTHWKEVLPPKEST